MKVKGRTLLISCYVQPELLILFLCFLLIVKQRKSSGELPATVITVLDQELEKINGNNDAQTLNEEFLKRNSNSVLHRAAGISLVALNV